MRWIVFLLAALLIGIQSIRAASAEDELSTRAQTRFLRVACSSEASQELSIAFFPNVSNLDQAMRSDSERWQQFTEICERKVKHVGGQLKWSSSPEITSGTLGKMNAPCSDEMDCEHHYACHRVTGRCIPALRISNLPTLGL